MLDRITPLILTYNEAPNIGRTLERLRWAQNVVVVDSGSSDGTQSIVAGFGNARLFERPFDTHAQQWNAGLESGLVDSEWVLALDADYLVPQALVDELAKLAPDAATAGYQAEFVYHLHGRALSGSLYPPVTVLYRRQAAHYVQDGHTQRLALSGAVRRLREPIAHDDRKPLSRWLASQERYAELECKAIMGTARTELRWPDRLRMWLVVMPWLAPLYALVLKGCLLDGPAGWHYAVQRGIAEAILSMKLAERRLHAKNRDNGEK